MSRSKLHRYGAAPVLIIGLGAPALMASGCSDDNPLGGECEAQIAARFEQLSLAVDGLVKVSGELKADVAVACAAIATDLGEAPPDVGDGSNVSDDDVEAACAAAVAGIDAELNAGASITVAIEGGECKVAAEAQFACEAECDVSGECTPGSIEANCDPGELSGICEGTCEAGAVCKGSASVEANCEGSCGGNCTGTCDGNNVDGAKCDGVCEGTCTGECELAADAMVECGANVECKGGCSVEYTAPSCEGTIEPPACNLDADCQAGCEGQAKFEAECTPPSVVVEVSGGVSGNLASTLEANLPALYNAAFIKGELALSAAGDVAAAFTGAAEAVVSVPACALQFGADFAADVSGAASASVSVSVSVKASASASTSAGAG